nr:TPA_asm: m47.8 ORF [Murid betaherpesvirus 1]DBA07989.1 TPA_asm: m47.8 ORF [Murid betaherpesvirus 1]
MYFSSAAMPNRSEEIEILAAVVLSSGKPTSSPVEGGSFLCCPISDFRRLVFSSCASKSSPYFELRMSRASSKYRADSFSRSSAKASLFCLVRIASLRILYRASPPTTLLASS